MLKEITPLHLRCGMGACPAIYETEDGKLVVVGKRAPSELSQELQGRVSDDEGAVIISRDYFRNVLFPTPPSTS